MWGEGFLMPLFPKDDMFSLEEELSISEETFATASLLSQESKGTNFPPSRSMAEKNGVTVVLKNIFFFRVSQHVWPIWMGDVSHFFL